MAVHWPKFCSTSTTMATNPSFVPLPWQLIQLCKLWLLYGIGSRQSWNWYDPGVIVLMWVWCMIILWLGVMYDHTVWVWCMITLYRCGAWLHCTGVVHDYTVWVCGEWSHSVWVWYMITLCGCGVWSHCMGVMHDYTVCGCDAWSHCVDAVHDHTVCGRCVITVWLWYMITPCVGVIYGRTLCGCDVWWHSVWVMMYYRMYSVCDSGCRRAPLSSGVFPVPEMSVVHRGWGHLCPGGEIQTFLVRLTLSPQCLYSAECNCIILLDLGV